MSETILERVERLVPDTGRPFVAVRQSNIVMRGADFVCRACSHTMAKRIANALNEHKTNDEGV